MRSALPRLAVFAPGGVASASSHADVTADDLANRAHAPRQAPPRCPGRDAGM